MNNATRLISIITGILLAITGFEHGLFDAIQGNKPTDGYLIQAIGKDMMWWKWGGEEAFTVIPNFLITGIIAMCISLFIIIWCIFYIHKKNGTTIFLFSFVLLTLVGGGIGFTPFYLVTWAYATRINKPLN